METKTTDDLSSETFEIFDPLIVLAERIDGLT
jgi:hypothetical protein